MNKRRFGCGLMLLILIVGFSLQSSSPWIVLSQEGQEPVLPPPVQEQVVPFQRGLEKLSADLRAALTEDQRLPHGPSLSIIDQSSFMVSVLVQPGTDIRQFFLQSARSRQFGGFQWVNGQINPEQLLKLASHPQVLGIISTDTYHVEEAPGLEDLRAQVPHLAVDEARKYLAQGGPGILRQQLQQRKAAAPLRSPSAPVPSALASSAGSAPSLLDIHDVRKAWAAGFKGEDVIVALVDTGVDFAHPDLQWTQAVIPQGPYAGWPFAYDAWSGARYAMDPQNILDPQNFWHSIGETQYVSAKPVTNKTCSPSSCSARLQIGGGVEGAVPVDVSWPNTSKSGGYLFSVHPDILLLFAAYNLELEYPDGWTPPVIIVSDENVAGEYDTVYVDVNYNRVLGDPGEKMSQAQPVGGIDLTEDGTWDLSAGMLAWISDGVHHPPGVAALYPDILEAEPPQPGKLLAFISDQNGHGTNCASEIAGQAQITDPEGLGPSNPLYAGGGAVGGV
ncbi:MAG: hypothetical protein IH586_12470, partial [Anaerolineaceae bacterium]|nr:hypothetical protein [Anaerolineaceae bacterium]